MSQDSGTISGVRSVGISIGTVTTSGNDSFWTGVYFWPLNRRYTTKPANQAMAMLAMPSRTRKKISNASTDMMPS
jgi:hypothetical protein